MQGAMEVLKSENNRCYLKLVTAEDLLTWHVDIEDETMELQVGKGRFELLETVSKKNHLAVGYQTLLDLIDGRLNLMPALRDDRVFLLADLQALDQFDRVFSRLMKGLLACPSAPALVTEFRAQVSQEELSV